jgi:hypothetical protein
MFCTASPETPLVNQSGPATGGSKRHQAKYCGDRFRKAASRERISRDKNWKKTQLRTRPPKNTLLRPPHCPGCQVARRRDT